MKFCEVEIWQITKLGNFFSESHHFVFCACVLAGLSQLACVTLYVCDAFVSWRVRMLSSRSTIIKL